MSNTKLEAVMENNADKDITAILRECFPKDLGTEKNNLNYFNCIVKLATNGPELLRK